MLTTRPLGTQGLALPIISLGKRQEEIYVPGRTDSVRLSRRSPALRLLQQCRSGAEPREQGNP